MDIARGKTRHPTFHQEAAHAILGPGPDDSQVCHAAVGDPHLRTIQDVGIAVTTGSSSHAGRITASIRLRQAEATNHLTACHEWQPALLLFLGAISRDGEHGKRALYIDK